MRLLHSSSVSNLQEAFVVDILVINRAELASKRSFLNVWVRLKNFAIFPCLRNRPWAWNTTGQLCQLQCKIRRRAACQAGAAALRTNCSPLIQNVRRLVLFLVGQQGGFAFTVAYCIVFVKIGSLVDSRKIISAYFLAMQEGLKFLKVGPQKKVLIVTPVHHEGAIRDLSQVFHYISIVH